ncbi:DnaA regulatory inactivator Hda [Pelagibaculum spongiae]|uniref:DnaA regulatory inactivator Hda n=1 Tax=Pelagibaculum spongiae TaxID=2080658 RepID=A0A2V1GRP6_9GAMM|nr:DnaA regulatory inactivator Hda [Pelagibaculum spongiae]PVZ64334.1 DnaA regulatory inactivator Hda [Pelagibaculum spongiae]
MSLRQDHQLPLGLRLRDDATFNSFYPDESEQVLACLQMMIRGEGEPFVYLWGSEGSGKTHLLQAACQSAADAGLGSFYMPLEEADFLDPEMLQGLEQLDLVCLDDIHLIAGRADWEEALFHLYNRVRNSNGKLLVGGDKMPQALAVNLPDLRSRLAWGLVFQLPNMTDQHKISALQLRAGMRGLELTEEAARFLLKHSDKRFSLLFEKLDQLDKASLVAKRKLTIPFIKEVLGF